MSTSPPSKPRRRLSAEARREVIERSATELFAERGFRLASMDAIAAASGVSVPVLYDHFASKRALHRRLLERHTDELLAVWREHLPGDTPAASRIPRAIDAWAGYVQTHPFAARMFAGASGDHEIDGDAQAVQARGRAALVEILGAEAGARNLADDDTPVAFEMAVELIRAALTGLAVWWREHPDVPREAVVATIMNVLWVGFERTADGERWEPNEERA